MYNPPQPPQQSSGSGCFKAAGITCGVLLILVIIGGFMVYNAVKKTISNPNSILGQSFKIGIDASNGVVIQQAIVKYKNDNGKYPPNLTALTPKYLDPSKLHAGNDPNPDPSHVSWTYTRPDASATAETPLLSLPITMEGKPLKFVIKLDGSSTTTVAPPPSGGNEQSPSAAQ